MGVIRTIAIVICTISFIVFVALFGRLPVFRKTPIGFLHRLIWIHVPHLLQRIDDLLTGRRISRGLTRTGHYLMNEPHPLVLIFFILLQAVSEVLFIPRAWPRISSLQQKFIMPLIVTMPYWTLYLSATTGSTVTARNHKQCMLAYPYDYTLFHPGYFCSTCHRAKPARSKHCSVCNVCVQKQDHHCVWINNCVGRNNYVWFNALLLSISVLMAYGAILGYKILDHILQERYVPSALTRGSLTTKRWSTRMTWGDYLEAWSWAISVEWRIGGVALLSFMAFPLGLGFLGYHIYLIWAGMTTNESSKWSDWREDIEDGLVWRARLEEIRSEFAMLPEDVEPRNDMYDWPSGHRATWWTMLTKDGGPPKMKSAGPTSHDRQADPRWTKVQSIVDVINIYDLGFGGNLHEVLFHREKFPRQ